MPSTKTFSSTASHPILDELQSALHHVLALLKEKWKEIPLSLAGTTSSATKGAEQTFRLLAGTELVVQIRFGVYPFGPGTYEVYIALANGPTRRLTYTPSQEDANDAEKAWLSRTATSILLEEIEPRLGLVTTRPDLTESDASAPQIELDCEGTIQHLNPEASKIFDDDSSQNRAPNFFTFVHGHNLRRVIRDLEYMSRGEMQSARWLLRLQSEPERWRWYRARVTNRLQTDETIHLHLRSLNTPQNTSAEHVPQ